MQKYKFNTDPVQRPAILKMMPDLTWWPAPEPDISASVALLDPVGLDVMASVALLDRVETKYVFHERRLAGILAALTAEYRVLEINEGRLNHYRTLYFDTADFALFRRHQGGGRNRYKVRSRSYIDTDLSFLEVKHKVKQNRTVKNRIRTADFVDRLTSETSDFLSAHLPPNTWRLTPKLWNEYTRITLVSKHNPERVTLDLNLHFQRGEKTIALPGIVIAEVKQPGAAVDSAFVRLMRELVIRPSGFSKYCIGVSMLYPDVKHNHFKPTLRLVGKLIQGGEYHVQ